MEKDLSAKFGMRDYLTEIEILDNFGDIGKKIMDSALVKELEMDVIEVRRNGSKFTLPPGDFFLQAHDTLKVRCNIDQKKCTPVTDLKYSHAISKSSFEGVF